MTKKTTPSGKPENQEHTVSAAAKRWFWIRTALLTVLIFIFVMWYTYPTYGNIAILWSAGLAGLILAYFVYSYYKLYR